MGRNGAGKTTLLKALLATHRAWTIRMWGSTRERWTGATRRRSATSRRTTAAAFPTAPR